MVGLFDAPPDTGNFLDGVEISGADLTDADGAIGFSLETNTPPGHYWLGVYLDADKSGTVNSGDLIVASSPELDLPASGNVVVDAQLNRAIP